MLRFVCFFSFCFVGCFAFEEKQGPEDLYFSKIQYFFEKEDWDQVSSYSRLVSKNYPFYGNLKEIYYYWGVSCFHKGNYGKANELFSKYLQASSPAYYFEELMRYKCLIAEAFRKGKRAHLFNWDIMPRWMPSRSEALEIYDEIIASLPHHELAAKSLYGKANILAYFEDFQESIDAYTKIIQRYPKHPLAPKSFSEIGRVYFLMAQSKYQDPTLLDQSLINIKKFYLAFPGHESIALAEKWHGQLQSAFAENLYDMATFFMKRKKEEAAEIYYKKIIASFPESESALKASRDLEKAGKLSSVQ